MSQPKQQIGLLSAVFIGLASMLGAGVFVVFHSAFALSPSGFYWALALAALVATLNSWSIYSLARAVDRPGGVYAYSRVYLNDGFSFASGFAFVFGKIGSIAAIALAFNSYVLSEQPFWPAVLAVVGLTAVNILGIQRTAAVAAVLAITTTIYFTFMAGAGLILPAPVSSLPLPNAPLGSSVFGAAAVFFFAFAGYARVATLGNEVRDAKRNIPKAIVISLAIVMVLYTALAFVMLKFLGLDLLTAPAPFKNLAEHFIPVVPHQVTIVVATLASLGSMLALLAGVSRTAASMGEDRELPAFFQSRNRYGSPWVAEVIIAAGAIALIAVGDLTWVIGFSSFSVLFYYSIGHLSVLRQSRDERVAPRVLAVAGFLLCWLLALQVEGPAVPVSLIVLALALAVRFVAVRRRASGS